MDRALRLKRGFAIAKRRIPAGTPAAAALAATLARLTTATLPGPQDSPVLVPPVRRAWARRVPGFNMWVFFTFTDTFLRLARRSRLQALADAPQPMPIEGFRRALVELKAAESQKAREARHVPAALSTR